MPAVLETNADSSEHQRVLRKLGWFGLVVVALATILYAGAVAYLALNETRLVYVAAGRSGRFVPADTVSFPWDTVRVRAADSVPVLLLVTRVDTVAARPWTIFLHGNGGFIGSRGNVERYRLLRDAGFNVLAVEYRGYGASQGAGVPTERGVQADAAAGLEYLRRAFAVPPTRIVAYGHSLGGGVATYLATESRLAALVTEGTFTSLPDVGAAQYPWVPVRMVMRNRFDNVSRAREARMPWVVMHGRPDDEVPFSHAEALAAAGPMVRLVALNGGHDNAVTEDRATAFALLRDLASGIQARERR